jgi:mannose-6-phosphate isomerase-like protein (cupin superfamily)
MRRLALGLLLLGGGFGYTVAPRATPQVPQTATTPASLFQAESWTNLPLTPNQPDKPTYWSIGEMTRVHETLKARAARGEPLNARSLMALPMTRTHGYTVGHRSSKDPVTADQHDGVTDVYFVMGGSAAMTAGGQMVAKQKLTEGEFRGSSIDGGDTFSLKAGDVLQVPPGMPHSARPGADGFTYLLLKINVAQYPWPIVAGGFGTGDRTPALAPDQPPTAVYWSVDDFRKQHMASAAGRPGNLFPRATFRTHGWVSVYRSPAIMTRPLPAEMHTGVSDVYIVLGGRAKMIVGGNLDHKHVFCEPRQNLPGGASCLDLPLEYQGDCSAGCQGGQTLDVKAGDLINMPPNTEHWITEPEPTGPNAGFTYMLFKIAADIYPWQLTTWDF